MKTNRLALIATLCSGIPRVIDAAPSEIAEEVKLAKSHDDDNSTLDEGQNVEIISPLLGERVESVNEKQGAESLELTAAERKEVGPLVRFKSQTVVVEEDEPITEPIDYEGLAKWADSVSSVG